MFVPQLISNMFCYVNKSDSVERSDFHSLHLITSCSVRSIKCVVAFQNCLKTRGQVTSVCSKANSFGFWTDSCIELLVFIG